MTYVLTIYFISAFGVSTLQAPVLDLATCKTEATKILLEIDPPSHIRLNARCTSAVREMGA